jgi:ArsR family transcriptional regulator, lead/cadmium/zinc/bismuth-responsive transcriptional repressor
VASEHCDLLCLDLDRAEQVRADLPPVGALEAAARRAKALADPTRLGVVAALAENRELCGCDLAWILGRAQNLVSHHLHVLRDADLVTPRREGKTVFYALTTEGAELLRAVIAEEHAA